MSSALARSAAIGVAQDALGALPGVSSAEVASEQNLLTVGYAVTYPLRTILCAMLLANVLPRLCRRDLTKESAELAAELRAAAPGDRQRDVQVPDPHARLHPPVRRRHCAADRVGRRHRHFNH